MDTDELEFEEGELESDDESSTQRYVPLSRPVPPESLLSSPGGKVGRRAPSEEEEESFSGGVENGKDDSSSDSETPSKRPYSLTRQPQKAPGGGEVFNRLARQFQESRKKKNNVWGSILQEESLTSDLSSIGVSKKKKPAGFSDRGSESYDFSLATTNTEEESKLNKDLDDYFQGKPTRRKRSLKDRLGTKKDFHEQPALDNMSIPPPGVPRIIPDISPALLEKGSLPDIAEELAAKLCEPKTELISGVLQIIGIPLTLKLFEQTQDIEKNGGKMIKSGYRRRTPGGLFLQLLRESKEKGIDKEAIKQLFNVSSKGGGGGGVPPQPAPKKNFEAELKEFRQMSQDLRNDHKHTVPEERTPEPFVEPEAPPNSVERPPLSIEEDELNCDTLDIELT